MEKKKIENILDNFSNLEKKLASINNENFDEIARISKEYSDLKPLASKAKEFLRLQNELVIFNHLFFRCVFIHVFEILFSYI